MNSLASFSGPSLSAIPRGRRTEQKLIVFSQSCIGIQTVGRKHDDSVNVG